MSIKREKFDGRRKLHGVACLVSVFKTEILIHDSFQADSTEDSIQGLFQSFPTPPRRNSPCDNSPTLKQDALVSQGFQLLQPSKEDLKILSNFLIKVNLGFLPSKPTTEATPSRLAKSITASVRIIKKKVNACLTVLTAMAVNLVVSWKS